MRGILLLLSFTPLALANSEPAPLTLKEVVFLAVENNRSIKNAYLARKSETYSIKAAKDFFVPHLIINPSIQTQNTILRTNTSSELDLQTEERSTLYGLAATVEMNLPIGGQVRVSWIDQKEDIHSVTDTFERVDEESESFSQAIEVTWDQALLKGAGVGINRANIQMAELQDHIRLWELKATFIENLSAVIFAYRNLIRTKRQIDIEERSLQQAQELMDLNAKLIANGRLPQVEIVQSESEVALKEIALLVAKNAFESAQLELIQLLDIDQDHVIIPVDDLTVEGIPLDLSQLLQLALSNRPDYQIAQQQLRIAQIQLKLAQDQQLWDVRFQAAYTIGGQDESHLDNVYKDDLKGQSNTWNVGFSMNHKFGDIAREQSYRQQFLVVEQLRNTLKELKETIRIEVVDQIRNIEVQRQRLKLAQHARELSEKKLKIEQEKIKVGRSSNFQILSFQNDLVSAKNDELAAIITYHNLITDLDRTLGTTLDTWKIKINP